jgi:hypothetical protein
MESINDVEYKQCARIEFLVAEKESVTNVHKCLCNVYGGAVFNRSTIDCWVKRMTTFEKKESRALCFALLMLSLHSC